MSDLTSLYQELILDHAQTPRNQGKLCSPSHQASGHNPLCGDDVTLHLEIVDDVIRDVRFRGTGCAISTASISMLTQAIKNRPLAYVEALFSDMHRLLTDAQTDPDITDRVGKLAAFEGVRQYPMRVKCATLAWHTLNAALHGSNDVATTEED